MAGAPNFGDLLDYIGANQGLSPDAAAASDQPSGISSLFGGLSGGNPTSSLLGGASTGLSFLPPPFDLTALLPALASFGLDLSSMFGGRSSTGPGSATADIASAAGNSDPILALLGMGAGNIPSGTPISSPSAGPSFGPYFNDARTLLDLARWGPGGLTDKRAEADDTTTLKNALTGLGNPGQEGPTLQLINQAFQQGQKYLTPQNINLLRTQLNPQELTDWNNYFGNRGGGGGGGGGGQPNPNPNPNPGPNPNSNFQLPGQGILNMAQLGSLLGLLGGGGGFAQGWYH